jgi:hypothetical protein
MQGQLPSWRNSVYSILLQMITTLIRSLTCQSGSHDEGAGRHGRQAARVELSKRLARAAELPVAQPRELSYDYGHVLSGSSPKASASFQGRRLGETTSNPSVPVQETMKDECRNDEWRRQKSEDSSRETMQSPTDNLLFSLVQLPIAHAAVADTYDFAHALGLRAKRLVTQEATNILGSLIIQHVKPD